VPGADLAFALIVSRVVAPETKLATLAWWDDVTLGSGITPAASVVAAHNHVLRRWLRGECPDHVREVDEATQQVISQFTAGGPSRDRRRRRNSRSLSDRPGRR
jgi:hypothetical protein